jgi:DNA modification methylase
VQSDIHGAFAIEQVPIGRLRPDPANPRRIGEDELEALTRSIRQWGLVQPILARREDRAVIGGHQRLVAARRLGLKTVPVIWVDLDAHQAHLLGLALNRIAGEWDEQLLARMLTELQGADGVDLSLSGFGDDELKKFLASLDARERVDRPEDFDLDAALEEATRSPRCQPGNLWQLGEHRLLCGDSTDAADVARLMGDERAACMWTDPPYGVAYTGKTSKALRLANDVPDGLEAVLRAAFAHATAVLEPGAPVYVCRPSGHEGLTFFQSFLGAGWQLHQELVWVKDSMVLGHSDYHYRHEAILYGWTQGPGRSGRGRHKGSRWRGGNDATTVFELDRPRASRSHPTTKPVELVTAMLTNSTSSGDVVYEPFVGSGSTLIAADRLSRCCYGIEIDPRYCDVALRRWERFSGQAALLLERLDAAA